MKAILFDETLTFIDDYPVPEPGEGEALVRVSLAGICNTDLEITRGYMGFKGILGHEFAGMVESADGPEQKWVGKRVVGEINCGCGHCDNCRRGLTSRNPEKAFEAARESEALKVLFDFR